MHGLNDNDMLVEIIKELNKMEEGSDVTGEQVLVWAKGVEAQSVIIASLSKNKRFLTRQKQ